VSKVLEYLKSVSLSFKEVKQPRRYVFEISADRLREVVKKLTELNPTIYSSTISAVDYINEGVIEVNYCLWVIDEKLLVVLRVRVPRDSPKVPTIADILPGALNGEMEAYDLMGVVFDGNSRLRRAFLAPPDIASQGLFPLRKDFKV